MKAALRCAKLFSLSLWRETVKGRRFASFCLLALEPDTKRRNLNKSAEFAGSGLEKTSLLACGRRSAAEHTGGALRFAGRATRDKWHHCRSPTKAAAFDESRPLTSAPAHSNQHSAADGGSTSWRHKLSLLLKGSLSSRLDKERTTLPHTHTQAHKTPPLNLRARHNGTQLAIGGWREREREKIETPRERKSNEKEKTKLLRWPLRACYFSLLLSPSARCVPPLGCSLNPVRILRVFSCFKLLKEAWHHEKRVKDEHEPVAKDDQLEPLVLAARQNDELVCLSACAFRARHVKRSCGRA